MKRRDFLKVLGASGAGVATVGCTTGEVEKLIPYVVPSEDIVPGVPTWYASTCRECPAGCGIVVETHSGRVTKVEGNADNPISRGNLCARGQASVQGLYHPDRYRGPTESEEGLGPRNVSWGVAERTLADRIRQAPAGSVVFLTGVYTGSMERLVNSFVGAIGARRVIYDPFAGQPRDLDFSGADFLVSFGADFLETWGSPVDYAWQFKQMHAYRNGRRGKFVWVGPHRPLTGLNADEWIAPRPGTEAAIALAMSGGMDAATAAQQTGVEQAVIERLAREFRAGRGVALGPGVAAASRNGAALQAAVARLNGGGAPAAPAVGGMRDVLGLVQQMQAGQVQVLLVDAPDPAYTLPGGVKFAEAMRRVPYTVSFATFPDETSRQADLVLPNHHFLEAWDDYVPRAGVYEIVQPAMRPVFNTKQVGDVLLSVARQLGGAAAGVATANTYHDYLRAASPGGAAGWRDAVKRGGVWASTGVGNPPAPAQPAAGGAVAAAAADAPAQAPAPAPAAPAPVAAPAAGAAAAYQPVAWEGPQNANFHLVVYPSYRFFDGRTANRPWLLELPDPVTKVSWQSWVEIHPTAARELQVEQGDLLEVTSQHGTIRAPAYVWPGVRPDTLAIQMGMGHQGFGRYSEGRGVNANTLLGATAADTATGAFAPYGLRVAARKAAEADRHTPIFNKVPEGLFEGGVRVQHDRALAQAISLAALQRADAAGPGVIPGTEETVRMLRGNGGFAPIPSHTDPASYPPPGTHYGEYIAGETRWAMTVDLQNCIGCSACVVACNAENNIPVVGPEEMKRGRELTWLRIERYYGVGRDEAEAYREDATNDVRFLPMLCQHCGNAPCEPVCPVYAAYHTPDGLNGQVYNRCVGTRYCANNCPYKVRYFNWFTYDFPEPLNWQLNPDVTVREKGVMEKCTFCVQRIHEARRDAVREGRQIRDGEVVPACVQTCPTQVFTFGNIADPNSAVARAARGNRSYRALDAVNTQPAIVYLKKVTLHEPRNGGHADHAEHPEAAEAGAGAGAH